MHVAVQKLLAANRGEVGSITATGHSLGGALASMCAFDIAWSGINKDGDQQWGDYIPVTAFTFEAPRVGRSLICPETLSNGKLLSPGGCRVQADQAYMSMEWLTAEKILVPVLH